MNNEDKVILMTKLAAYEQHEKKKNIAVGNYFRSDYMGLHMLKSVVCGTIAYLLLFGLYIFYDLEVFMQDIYKMDVLAFGKQVLIRYVIFVCVYVLVTYVVHSLRYKHARKNLRIYYNNLKKLRAMYEKQI